jgi:chitinase
VTISRLPQPDHAQGYRATVNIAPGMIEAERFDEGGEGVGYHDSTAEDSGSGQFYRKGEAVDVDVCDDDGGGYSVGGVVPGEWLTYTVIVAEDGEYDLEARVASPGGGGTFHVEFGGRDETGPMEVPDAFDWQEWQTIVNRDLRLNAGRQVMKVVLDAAGKAGAAKGQWVSNFNWIYIRRHAADSGTPATRPASAAGTDDAPH